MDSKNKGSIFLPRSIMETNLWKENPTKLKLYLYFVLMVNHKNNGKFKQGEHITSYSRISKETGLNRNTISKNLKWLKEEKYIELLPARGTRVKILNHQ